MSSMLRVSDAASLAIHAMGYLANMGGKLVSIHDIARELNVSENHLAKVAQRLAKCGLVVGVRGPKGGLKLSKDAKEISLLTIYEAIEGNVPQVKCLLGRPAFGKKCCILGELLHSINQQVVEYLGKTTLAQFVG